MPTLIELMKDPSVVVRDTTAWTVGRICEMLPEAAINDIYLAPLLQCLMEGLSAEPRVASNVCWVRQPRCCWTCEEFLTKHSSYLYNMNIHTHTYIYSHIYIYYSYAGVDFRRWLMAWLSGTHNCCWVSVISSLFGGSGRKE